MRNKINYKKIVIAGLIVGLLNGASFADPHFKKRSADLYPSIGFTVKTKELSGDVAEIDGPNQANKRYQYGERQLQENSIGLDIRIPFQDSFVFNTGYELITYEDDYSRSRNTYNKDSLLKGDQITIGVRFYLK